MLIDSPKVKVSKVVEDTREMLSKDGVTKVRRRIVNILFPDPSGDVCKVTCFDPTFSLPKPGELWQLPPVKRLECFDGLIQNIMI